MLVGIPKEIKTDEYRVGATPGLVKLLVEAGHRVLVQTKAGAKVGYPDTSYQEAGAEMVSTAKQTYEAEVIVKVKEPQEAEYALLKKGQILFCFLHLSADPEQLRHLLERQVIGIAFETIRNTRGALPLLMPMSEIAGRVAMQSGALALQMPSGGKGILVGGVPGVLPAKVVVLGGGSAGTEAARLAMGMGADVTLLEKRVERMRELDALYGDRIKTLFATPLAIKKEVLAADVVIGAVLIPGKKTTQLVTEEMVEQMAPGSVLVDVSIDQGGCCATSHPTTHSRPTYTVHDVVHYCVANMPGAYARTATEALTNAITPYLLNLVNRGCQEALQEDKGFLQGLNVHRGKVTHAYVAQDCGYAYTPPESIF